MRIWRESGNRIGFPEAGTAASAACSNPRLSQDHVFAKVSQKYQCRPSGGSVEALRAGRDTRLVWVSPVRKSPPPAPSLRRA